jgi:hypothetical protein
MFDTEVILLTATFGLLIAIMLYILKSASHKSNSKSFIVNRYILIGFILLIYSIYRKYMSDKQIKIISDIPKIKYEIIVAALFTIIAALIEAYLIDINDVSYIGPLSISWTILFLGLIGKFYLNEEITNFRCFGYLLVCVGLIIISIK